MKTKNFLAYTLSDSIWRIGSVTIFVGFAAYLVVMNPKWDSEYWNNWSDQYLAYATLMIAVFLWFGEQYRSWRNHLPKKLNVTYQFEDQEWFLYDIHLTSESDLRQWGQSAACTPFNNGNHFKLAGYLVTLNDVRKGREIRYEAIIYLDAAFTETTNRTSRYDSAGKLIK